MSDAEDDVDEEIQRVLFMISQDMQTLKRELSSIDALIRENAVLPKSMKTVNDALIVNAKAAGIDLDDILNAHAAEEKEVEENQNKEDPKKSSNTVEHSDEEEEAETNASVSKETTAQSNASALARQTRSSSKRLKNMK